MTAEIDQVAEAIDLRDANLCTEAANYLFDQVASGSKFICSGPANQLGTQFLRFVESKNAKSDLNESLANEQLKPTDRFLIARDWVESFVSQSDEIDSRYIGEAASILTDGSLTTRNVVDIDSIRVIEGLLGDCLLYTSPSPRD